jgi:16S rRNA (uracil1498-N3)-methyltransferase
VQIERHQAVEREALRAVHLVVGMPANDRMDWLIEKATELGVASVQPLMSERSVLKLLGERADKKVAHWQSVAISACEQCGGNRVPVIHEVMSLSAWAKARSAQNVLNPDMDQSLLLSLRPGSLSLRDAVGKQDQAAGNSTGAITFLSGPEGGLSPAEEAAALACGFAPVTLGPRVLRSETAALAALVALLV